jgi:DNA-binding GntR family transcriptional regulator
MNSTIPFRLPDLLAKELARALEEEILYGQLAPETRLVEEEVAQRFGISRSPVREALRLLEQDGLVVREARRGIWVAPIGRADLDSVYSCRVALEGLAAEQAANSRKPEHVKALRAVMGEMEQAFGARDVRAYFQANVRLTDAIHDAADNPTLRRLLSSIGKQAQRYRYLAYSRAPQLLEISLAGNRDVIGAIAGGDPAKARALTEKLLRRSWEAVGGALDAEMKSGAQAVQSIEGDRTR